jgi:protein dithiol:quinone oxidoreductase
MTPFTFRQLNFIGLATCLACMAFVVVYIQRILGLEPCPLCVAQRVAMIATASVFLVAALHAPRAQGRWFYAVLTALMAAAGAGIAGRHVWLQGLPPEQVPACGPTLEYLMDMLPFLEVMKTLLRGDGNCAVIDWAFLGLSLPGWSLVGFTGLALYALAAPVLSRKET